jgi:preprotein translocase subunit SecD
MLEFPRWKYVVILIVVVLSALYALPNAYQKDPSVQIAKNRPVAVIDDALVQRVNGVLEQASIAPKSVAIEGEQLIVRLNGAQDQTRAADALRPVLGDDFTTALNLVPTTPKWLERIAAKPMSLGLDLQGGVHFMMQVDQNAALEKRIEGFVDAIRLGLREERLAYTAVTKRPDHSIEVVLAPSTDVAKARQVVENRISVRLPESEFSRLATEAIEQNRHVISNRINSIGVAEPVLQRQGEDRLVIQLPGLQDTAEAKRLIGAAATLEFRAVTGDELQAAAALADGNIPADSRIYYNDAQQPLLLSRRVLVSGEDLVNAVPGTDSQTGLPSVSITLNAAGGKRMLDHTLENVGNRLGIVYVERIPTVSMVNGEEVRSSRTTERVISSSTIRGVFGREFQTTGLGREEAASLARQLKAGALAAPMDFIEESVIGPSLGAENVSRGVTAVGYAFIFTLVFFALYYRMFGLITCTALLLNLMMVVAIMSMFGATMTLPGFAGLALSIAMSVDANVLINERIREELRAGLPPRTAIAGGYDKASGTIFDSNMTALLAGVALYAFGTGPLRGFALTMLIGIITSVFTAVTVSRGIATLLYSRRKKLKTLAI